MFYQKWFNNTAKMGLHLYNWKMIMQKILNNKDIKSKFSSVRKRKEKKGHSNEIFSF